MTRLRIAPIVEGDGEVACIRILLQRIVQELLGGDPPDVLKPIRCKPDKLRNFNAEEVQRTVELAFEKLGNLPTRDEPSLVLILVDSEGECPKDLARGSSKSRAESTGERTFPASWPTQCMRLGSSRPPNRWASISTSVPATRPPTRKDDRGRAGSSRGLKIRNMKRRGTNPR